MEHLSFSYNFPTNETIRKVNCNCDNKNINHIQIKCNLFEFNECIDCNLSQFKYKIIRGLKTL